MKTVNHNATDRCITCHAAYGAIAYANHTNEIIIHKIQAQALQHPTMFLGYTT